ncbi:MAG: hypothetical protein WKF37_14265 [Bryobacteraceae bacterium]
MTSIGFKRYDAVTAFNVDHVLALNATGLHFRARLLRIAKAPFMLQGIVDVVRRRRFAYVMTAKTNRSGSSKKLPVLGAICADADGYLGVGVPLGPSYRLLLHTLFAGALSVCLGLVVSEGRRSAPAFDPELLRMFWNSSHSFHQDPNARKAAYAGPD